MNLIRPQIRLTVRKDGLETIKVIKIEVPYKPSEDGSERVISFFLLDKDNLIVGYQKFDFGTKKYKGEIWINGIINYIQVYILTSTKGMWKEEYHI
ncbi:MAG: hypothetical protein JW893_09425 [Candidatus Omnitrophica bacterium]|nr:hypothetical protein [Candidatus Omnitrophota bacterium]